MRDNGEKCKLMIGMLCGVKSNKLIGFLKRESCLNLKLIILEGGMSCVGKMHLVKILRNSKEVLISKAIHNNRINTIFYLLLI
jgi:hypothetical protein